jgi:O-antigen/teichoic acid export membrane protein
MLSALALVTFPMSIGLSLVAWPVVQLGFGSDWLAAVPLIQVLGVSAAVSLFSAVGEALFSAHAWLKSILWMSSLNAALRLLLLCLLVPHQGLLGGAVAAAAIGVLQETIYVGFAMHRLRIRLSSLLASVTRPAVAVMIMATVLNAVGLGWTGWDARNANVGRDLVLAVILGSAVYVVSVLSLWQAAGRPHGAEMDAMRMLKRYFSCS